MGKLIPVDHTQPGSTSDIVCSVCRRPWGGLFYDKTTETFRHRDPDECNGKLKVASRR